MPIGSPQWMYASGGDYYEYKIPGSCRFNNPSSPRLTRTPGSAGNRQVGTFSCWFKRSNENGGHTVLFSAHTDRSVIRFTDDHMRVTDFGYSGADGTVWSLVTTQEFRDYSGWIHLVVRWDTTQSTASNRVKIYLNGTQVTDFSSESYPAQNRNTWWGSAEEHHIGARLGYGGSTTQYWDGYVADAQYVNGSSLGPESFGEAGTYGDWKPIEYEGSYGTTGFHLDFATGTLGNDVSGNNNDFAMTNLNSYDQMQDSPTNNFATFNPLHNSDTATFSEGALRVDPQSSPIEGYYSTLAASSGKWYCEWRVGYTGGWNMYGIASNVYDNNFEGFRAGTANSIAWGAGDLWVNGSSSPTGYSPSFTAGDVVQVAMDLDNNKFYVGKNNSWDASGNPSGGTNGYNIVSGDIYHFGWKFDHDGIGGTTIANFGQDSSFAGAKTAQGNQDDNDIGDFYYTPPTGFLALCTANLPDVAIKPSQHFNTILYSGDNGTQSVTGVGFQPDLIWKKARNEVRNHYIADSVRGVQKELISNSTDMEDSSTSYTQSFNSDGWTMGATSAFNKTNVNYVAWNWKAGTTVTNTAGNEDTQVSANPDAGFSIVGWTNDGNEVGTRGHGLSKAPEVIITKIRSGYVGGWGSYWGSLGNNKAMRLDSNIESRTNSAWNNTTPTSTVFSVGSPGGYGDDSYNNPIIAYCWHSVDGYSRVGKYTGNGNSDGTFIYFGFRPAYVMIKNTSDAGDNWYVADNKRDVDGNPIKEILNPNRNAEEYTTGSNKIDFLSNGIKCRDSASGDTNINGEVYIYIAFAQTPVKYANGFTGI